MTSKCLKMLWATKGQYLSKPFYSKCARNQKLTFGDTTSACCFISLCEIFKTLGNGFRIQITSPILIRWNPTTYLLTPLFKTFLSAVHIWLIYSIFSQREIWIKFCSMPTQSGGEEKWKKGREKECVVALTQPFSNCFEEERNKVCFNLLFFTQSLRKWPARLLISWEQPVYF